MIKKGFTLAEVLITLSIIGVVAALTIPTFTVSTKNQTYAASLSAAVNTLETAFANALIQENASSLEESSLATMSVTSLSKYLKNVSDLTSDFTAADSTKKYKVKTIGKDSDYSLPEEVIFSLKNGAIVYSKVDISSTDVLSKGGPATSRFALIGIDVNGSEMPNLVGRDIFMFILGQNGILYPYGSRAASLLASDGTKKYTYTDTNEAGTEACKTISSKIDGSGCTARLIENGYKVDY